jgi:hypothetical protein
MMVDVDVDADVSVLIRRCKDMRRLLAEGVLELVWSAPTILPLY